MNTNKDLNYRLYIQHEQDFRRISFSRELSRYRDISLGNVEQARRNFEEIRKDYLTGKGVLSDDPLRNIRYHFIIAVAMTSRFCIEDGMNHDIAYTLSDIYIRRADKCNNGDEIIEMLGEMFVDFASRMRELKKGSVTSRHIRRCIDYIYDHLPEKLTLADTAAVLKLDPTYLSKLFLRETGMGFRRFIIATKVNEAKSMLTDTELSFLDISLALGFSSQSAFISVFRQNTGVTPREYRNSARAI